MIKPRNRNICRLSVMIKPCNRDNDDCDCNDYYEETTSHCPSNYCSRCYSTKMQLREGVCVQRRMNKILTIIVVLQSSGVVKDMVEGGPDPWLFVATTEQE